MASRAARKAQARQRRIEQEQDDIRRAQRARRRAMLAGAVLVALVVAGVAITISVSGGGGGSDGARLAERPQSTDARAQARFVTRLLRGIPQHGTTLGNPHAPVTVIEYGDLECSVCDAFALDGGEDELISHDVRAGKVKLVYRSLETATGYLRHDAATIFRLQQSAAYAAGAQERAWNYILLFYHEQGREQTPYVTPAYLTGLARQIPGLNLARWGRDRFDPAYAAQLIGEARQFASLGVGVGTPTIYAVGPRGRTQPVQYAAPYSVVTRMIAAVS